MEIKEFFVELQKISVVLIQTHENDSFNLVLEHNVSVNIAWQLRFEHKIFVQDTFTLNTERSSQPIRY